MNKIELLSPVGDWDCLKAAVQNGADPALVWIAVSAADCGGGLPQHCVSLVSGVHPTGGDTPFFHGEL